MVKVNATIIFVCFSFLFPLFFMAILVDFLSPSRFPMQLVFKYTFQNSSSFNHISLASPASFFRWKTKHLNSIKQLPFYFLPERHLTMDLCKIISTFIFKITLSAMID